MDEEVTGVHEDTVHLLAGHKMLKDEDKDPDVLPKINKSDMERTMESIKEYLRSCHGVIQVPLAYVIMKNVIIETYSDSPKYSTPDTEMIARMLHLPPK